MNTHYCKLNSPYEAYGVAVEDCYEDDEGRFWAGNGEYGSQVNFCPVCGAKAPKQVEESKMNDNFVKERLEVSDLKDRLADAGMTLAVPPQPVGYWVVGEGGYLTHFPMYKKPTDEHIEKHEELLGWKWRDAE